MGAVRRVSGILLVSLFCLFAGSQLKAIGLPSWAFYILFAAVALLGSLAIYRLYNEIIWNLLQATSRRARRLWILLCLLAGFSLIFLIPLTLYPKANIVTLTATGERGPQANGSEVWLTRFAAGPKTPLTEMADLCTGDWVIIQKALVSAENQPSTLTCVIYSDTNIGLQIVKHAWSGMVRVEFNRQSAVYDLYSAEGDNLKITLPVVLDPSEKVWQAILFVASGVILAVILLGASLYFVQRRTPAASPVHKKDPAWFFYSLPMALSWVIYLLAYWPGFISPDTVTQLSQVVSGKFYNWHPAFHTMFLWLLTRLWNSSVPVILVQITAMSGLLGWGLSLIKKSGVPGRLVWLLAGYFALTPMLSLSLLTMWKDVPYSIALVALSLLILQVVVSNGDYLRRSLIGLLLGFSAALTALFRHNGVPVAFVSLASLVFFYPRQWRHTALAMITCGAIFLGVTGPLYRLANVDTTSVQFSNPPVMEVITFYLMNTHQRSGTQLTDAETAMIETVLPDQQTLDLVALNNNARQIDKMAYALTLRNPAVTAAYFLERSAFITQIIQPALGRYEYAGFEVLENPFGLVSAAKLPGVQSLLTRIALKTETAAWDWFFWRNAFWMYLLFFCVIVASVREKSAKYVILLIPVLANALPLAVVSGGQIARYILPTLILSPIFSVFLLFGTGQSKG